MSQTETSQPKQPSTARKVFAAILDFLFIFFVAGYGVSAVVGGTTSDGFKLEGAPAFVVFGIIVLYFIVGRRYLGGTLFQRLLGAR